MPGRASPLRPLAILAGLLLPEYVLVSTLVDLPVIGVATPFVQAVRLVVPVALGALGAGFLLARRGPPSDLLQQLPPVRWPLLAAQPFAYAGATLLARHFLYPGAPAPPSAVVAGVLAALLASALMAVLAVVPARVLRELVLHRWRLPLLAIGAGILVWRAAVAAEGLWGVLSSFTLHAAALLLSLTPFTVTVDPARDLLGLDDFLVAISPECSGADGIGFVLLFQSIWLSLTREQLRFPQALALLPLGVVAAMAANLLRISIMLVAGAVGFVPLAAAGLHSKLGWLLFMILALGTVVLAERVGWMRRRTTPGPPVLAVPPEAAAYILPLLATLTAALVAGLFAVAGLDLAYGLRVLAGGAALFAVRRSLPAPSVAPHVLPVLAGLAVGAIWIAVSGAAPRPEPAALAALPAGLHFSWIAARVAGACLLIPVVEELAFRGFLLRWLTRSDFVHVHPRAFTRTALALSSIAFAALHQHFALAAFAGVVFGLLAVWRGRLSDAIIAHAVTNAALAVAVLGYGQWDLW